MKKDQSKLTNYAKLRNVFVHRYAEVDYNLLYDKAVELINVP